MAQRTFTFNNGLTVNLRRISQFVLQRLMVDNTSKYPVPKKVIKVGTRQEEIVIEDYNNENWLALVKDQQRLDISETLANLAVFAVTDEVPDSDYDFYYDMATATRGKDVSDSFIKGLWLLDQIETEDELGNFQEAIIGLSNITEKAVEQSQEKFPDDNQ